MPNLVLDSPPVPVVNLARQTTPLKVLFELAHPKHFHQFRSVAEAGGEAFETTYLAKDKDVTVDLVREAGLPYLPYGRRGKTLTQKVGAAFKTTTDLDRAARQVGAELIVSRSSPYATLMAKVRSYRSVVMVDSEVVPLINYFVGPLADLVVTPAHFPHTFRNHVRVEGVFEECYLHPDTFAPDASRIEAAGLRPDEPFSVVRFVGWDANHDVGQGGFTEADKINLVERLSKHGQVVISSEASLPPSLEPYRLRLPASDLHSLIHYASLYVGDSQSMATEAALLGTPSVRFNSFVGPDDMMNFVVLENEHDLLRNARSATEAIEISETALAERWKPVWEARRDAYFASRPPLSRQLADVLLDFA